MANHRDVESERANATSAEDQPPLAAGEVAALRAEIARLENECRLRTREHGDDYLDLVRTRARFDRAKRALVNAGKSARALADARRTVEQLQRELEVAHGALAIHDRAAALETELHWSRMSAHDVQLFASALRILTLFQVAYMVGETALGLALLQATGVRAPSDSLATLAVAAGLALVGFGGFIAWYVRSFVQIASANAANGPGSVEPSPNLSSRDRAVALRIFCARVGEMVVAIPAGGTTFWALTGAVASGRNMAVVTACAGFGVVANFAVAKARLNVFRDFAADGRRTTLEAAIDADVDKRRLGLMVTVTVLVGLLDWAGHAAPGTWWTLVGALALNAAISIGCRVARPNLETAVRILAGRRV